ncbi:hypothetical protein PVAP13_3KG539000 [Panicum virgatum]|uniref:Uncharacterized protein n=2 Tax=Panicum virgatum TaxID=38727 RepID=A0A8T0VAV4_PANVG|nr:hypothetical protein PVAP13_3KG539000 [Panicum virgatum]
MFDRHRAAYYRPFVSLLAPPHGPPAGDDYSSSGSSSDMEDPPHELPAADPARGGGAPPVAPPHPLGLPPAHPARGGGAPPFAHVVPAELPARAGGAPAPPFARAVPPPLIRAALGGAAPRGRLDLDPAHPRRFRYQLGVGVGGRRQAGDGGRGGAALPGEIYNALKAIQPPPDPRRAAASLQRARPRRPPVQVAHGAAGGHEEGLAAHGGPGSEAVKVKPCWLAVCRFCSARRSSSELVANAVCLTSSSSLW